jgi:predicted RND superfamily exporter protein
VVFSHPRLILAAAAILTFLAAWKAPHVGFDYNLLNLQNQELTSVKAVNHLQETDAKGLIPGVVIAENLDDARAKIARLKLLPTVKETHSLTDLFPEHEDEKLVIIKRITHTLGQLDLNTDVSKQVNVAKARASIDSLLKQAREGEKQARHYVGLDSRARDAVEVFNGLIPPLERSQKAMTGLSQEELGRRFNRYQLETFGTMQKSLAFLRDQKVDRGVKLEDMPPEIVNRFLSPNGRVMIEVVSKGNIWDRKDNVAFVNDLRTVDARATGTPVQNYEYIELIRTSFLQAAAAAAIAIVLMVLLYFRSFGAALLSMLPLAVAMIWTGGLMVCIGLPFNPANIMTLPLVIGCGVAYGIYTVDRIRETGSHDLFANSTGKSILLSATTTIIGFASLLISDYRGMSSLGLLMSVSLTMCLVASIIVLPQLLRRK